MKALLALLAACLGGCGDNASPIETPDAGLPTCHATGETPDPCDAAYPGGGLTAVTCDPGVDLRHPPIGFGDCYEGDGLVCCALAVYTH